jgi:hypothetical protein
MINGNEGMMSPAKRRIVDLTPTVQRHTLIGSAIESVSMLNEQTNDQILSGIDVEYNKNIDRLFATRSRPHSIPTLVIFKA